MTPEPISPSIPTYPVRVWEVMLIVLGAIALIGLGMVGLGIKLLNNAFEPWRAELIARSLMDYTIPGGSQGVFGVNLGGVKLASVRSLTEPPDVILLVGKTPMNQDAGEADVRELGDDLPTAPTKPPDDGFMAETSRTETKTFCGKATPVAIETGQQTLSNQPSSLPALRYTVKLTEENTERLVVLTVNGANAPSKADAIFNSLQCK